MKKNISLTMVVILILSLVLTGCSQAKEEIDNPQDVENKEYTIGIATFGLANDYIRTGRDVAVAEIEERNGVAIETVNEDVSGRISAIENMIFQGVDAIIVHEGDVTQVIPSLEEAKKKGIKVIAMNSGYHDVLDLCIEPNNIYLGKTAAEEMVKLINQKGNIVEIYNDAGAMIRDRREAMHEVIKDYSDIKITNGFVYAWPDFYPDGKSKMEAILQANPLPGDVSAVFATFYGVGLAAAQAIREAGLQEHVVVVGIDSDPETYAEMKKPDSPYKVTVISDPEVLAKTAIDNLFKLLSGETVSEKHIFLPSEIITKDNIPEN